MTPLSPAAQAVRSAAPYAGPKLEGRIAAALRAAADRLLLDPEANSAGGQLLSCKDQLRDIAAELEAKQ